MRILFLSTLGLAGGCLRRLEWVVSRLHNCIAGSVHPGGELIRVLTGALGDGAVEYRVTQVRSTDESRDSSSGSFVQFNVKAPTNDTPIAAFPHSSTNRSFFTSMKDVPENIKLYGISTKHVPTSWPSCISHSASIR